MPRLLPRRSRKYWQPMCLLEIRCTHVRTMCKEDVIDAVIEQSEKMMKKEKESILAESKKCLK